MLQASALFTGLIEDIGRVVKSERRGDAVVLTIRTNELPCTELTLGESVAVNGVCLTVTAFEASDFTVLAGSETLKLTGIGELSQQSKVNLERAMRVGDRLGGHMVQGHVDGVGKIVKRVDRGANLEIDVRAPESLMRYIIKKGSICIDGISLTVNQVHGTSLQVALIPHSKAKTTLASKSVGDSVNLEVDMVAKYIERFQGAYS